MRFELDHLFVLCARGAPEADALLARGFMEGPANTHPGQGTACRRFFFANAYLELIWVSDASEALSEPARPTRLWERWSNRLTGASPFGVVLRPGSAPVAPFDTWTYRPPYLPADAAIEIARGTSIAEPEFFFLPFARAAHRGVQRPDHRLRVQRLSQVRVITPEPVQSDASRAVALEGVVIVESGREHRAHLTFDDGVSGGTADLYPTLPLVLHW